MRTPLEEICARVPMSTSHLTVSVAKVPLTWTGSMASGARVI